MIKPPVLAKIVSSKETFEIIWGFVVPGILRIPVVYFSDDR